MSAAHPLNNKLGRVGVVVPVVSSMRVELDGDGGILIGKAASFHFFKPVSIQSMWLVFQCMHKELHAMQQVPDLDRPEQWMGFYRNPALATADPRMCSYWWVLS